MRKLYAERPGWGQDFDYDEGRHLVAYRYAASLCPGKRVLDAGCGEGFGTQELSAAATIVVGVDYHEEAIATARRKWQAANLSFRVLDIMRDAPGAADFELIFNFQVLEHIEDDLAFLRNLRTALVPGGMLVLTTPNARMSFSENPCHLREYTAEGLRTLLRTVFWSVELKGVFGNERVVEFDAQRRRAVERILKLDPLGVRHLLPEPLLHLAFARLGQLVRRQAHNASGSDRISVEDFAIREGELDRCLDLVALCRP